MTRRIEIKEEAGKYFVRDVRIVKRPINNPPTHHINSEELYWRELPGGKPKLTPLHPYHIHHQPHGTVCYECGKWRADDEHWPKIIENVPSITRHQETFFDSNGCVVIIGKTDIEGTLLPKPSLHVWTNKEFKPHRDYCSDECYNKSRERKRKERRKIKRQIKYRKLPADKIPDGYCKICEHEILERRAWGIDLFESYSR